MTKTTCGMGSALALALTAGLAQAQPGTFTSLGTLSNGVTIGTHTGFVAGEVRWFKFEIPTGVSTAGLGFLDIDTNGGTYTGQDTQIGLYDNTGARIATNDDSGPGLYSMLSFGRTAPTRPGLAQTGNATSVGSTHAGGNGSRAAGIYWLAVGPFTTTWGATGWTATSTATRTGDVVLRLEYAADVTSGPPTGTMAMTQSATSCAALYTVTVTPGFGPPSTVITVTGDLSAVGGVAGQAFFNDGTNGDLTANDAIWSWGGTARGPGGTATFVVSDNDSGLRSSSGSLSVSTLGCSSGLPGTFVNLGSLTPATEQTITNNATLAPFEIKWYKMNLAADVSTTCSFFDVWTQFVTGGMQDTEIGLYDSVGNMVDNDDDDGAGPVGFLSELSWGDTSPTRTTFAGNVGGNGRDGTLVAGDYYLAVAPFNVTFGATNWLVTNTQSTATNTGAVDVVFHIGGAVGGSLAATSSTVNSGSCGTACLTTTVTVDTSCGAVGTVTVTADTTAIGGGPGVPMVDDGTGCDASAGDGIYSAQVVVGALADGGYSVPVSAVGSLSGSAGATVTVGVDNAGQSIATANKRGDGTSTTLTGSLSSANDVDIHAICVFDTSAAFDANVVGGASFDSQMFLFDGTGTGVLMDDDEPLPGTTLQSRITGVAFTLPGTVAYLAISRFDNDPVNDDAPAHEIWNDQPFDVVRAPDGTDAGGDFVLAGWNGTTAAGGAYTITLTGASQLCPADYDDGSGTGSPDCAVDISDLLYYLGLFDAGSLDADLDDGSASGTRDCGVDISDLLYYLARFDLGC